MVFLQPTLVAWCVLVPSVAWGVEGDSCLSSRVETHRDSVLLQTKHGILHSRLDANATRQPDAQVDFTTAISNCRFVPNHNWADELLHNTVAQDAYVAAVLKWDGKFAVPGVGITESGLTKDHINLDDSGNMASSGWYTAPSKESLHMSMLALVLDQTPLAYHWLSDTQHSAEVEALRRLALIIGAYEDWRLQCPACGGFIPWIPVTDSGFGSVQKFKLPALDNGQLAWAMIAIVEALQTARERHPEADTLIERFQTHIDIMKESVVTIFMHEERGRVFSMSKAKNPHGPMMKGNYKQKGHLADPFEGELMLMFIDLVTDGSTAPKANQRRGMWRKANKANLVGQWTSPDQQIGPITVQKGWRFSSHEAWKYLVLPYFEDETVVRLTRNHERVRTWDAHVNQIPGMKASCYGLNAWYVDRLGVRAASMGYDDNVRDTDNMVTPYGTFPLIMADRGEGLSWHQAMLARPKMQCQYGSTEASQISNANPQVALKVTWDTKVTTDVALVGGTGSLLKRYLERVGKYSRFLQRIGSNHQRFQTLEGEHVQYAPVPSGTVDSDEPDFTTCTRGDHDVTTVITDSETR